jgi:hypothetical protein
MFIFRVRYFILTLVLLLVEVLIALYVHDDFVRPYVGDFLVVIFLYCLLRSFLKASVLPVVIGVLLFAFVVEILQYFHFIALIGLEDSMLTRVILGNSFSYSDLVAYSAGALVVIVGERLC